MTFEAMGKLVQVIMLSDIKADTDPTYTPDDIYPVVASWITSLSGSGQLSMISFDPNTFRRRREFDKGKSTYNTTQYYVMRPEVKTRVDWEYRPTGSTAHIDASVRRSI